MRYLNHPLVAITLLGLVLFMANIGGLSIYILDEAKNATCAREMWERADWVVPTFNGELRTDKPPLHYYFMRLAYALWGANPFAARFFSALMGVGTVLVTYVGTRRLLDARTARYAAGCLLASLQVATQFHLATPDPFLIFFLTCTLLALLVGYQEQKPAWCYAGYVALGLATLAKGPVAVVLTGLAVLVFLLTRQAGSWAQAWAHLRAFRPFAGALVWAVTAVPWYVAVHRATAGAWTEGFFFKHNLSRFADTMEGHGGSPLLMPLLVIVGLLPFSIFVGQAVRLAWGQRRAEPLLLFSLIFVGVVTGFFALSRTKLPSYPAPAFPFLAILLGFWLRTIETQYRSRRWGLRASTWVWLGIATLIPVAVFIALRQDPQLAPTAYVSLYFLPLPLGAAFALRAFYQHQPMRGFYGLGGSFFLTSLLFFYLAFARVEQENPVSVARRTVLPASAQLIAYARFNPAFAFYYPTPIRRYESPEALAAVLGPDTYVVTTVRHLDDLQGLPLREVFRRRDLFEIPTTVILVSEGAAAAPGPVASGGADPE